MPDDDRANARDRCLRLLSRREHSALELRRKLADRGCDALTAAAVVSELREDGWQSDARFAESFVRNRIEQGYGPLRINFELAQRGVAAADVDALAGAAGGWEAIAERVQRKRFGSQAPTDRAEQAKRSRYLAQRGFLWEHIKAALSAAGNGAALDFDDGI